MKKVSIVLPTFNGEKFIEESINSVLNQTYQNWELIIVNDGSTDNTINIINKYLQIDPRIILISNEKNLKLPTSLNIGFKKATGEYYTWTSDDNMYKHNAIEKMVKYLNDNPNIDLVSFNCDMVDENKNFEQYLTDIYPNRKVLQLTYCCNIGACFMYRKSIANIVGEYEPDMFCVEDYEYWCRIALKGEISYHDENLYIYRKHPESLSSTKTKIVHKKIREVRHLYTQKIMKKLNLSSYSQIKMLLDFYYNEEKDIEWQRIAQNTNMLFFIIYKTIKYFR